MHYCRPGAHSAHHIVMLYSVYVLMEPYDPWNSIGESCDNVQQLRERRDESMNSNTQNTVCAHVSARESVSPPPPRSIAIGMKTSSCACLRAQRTQKMHEIKPAKHRLRACQRARIGITPTSEKHCDRHENQLVRMSARTENTENA